MFQINPAMDINQVLFGLFVLVALIAVIEATPHRKALKTEWKAWKKLNGKILKYSFKHILLYGNFSSFLPQERAMVSRKRRRNV